MDTNTGSRSGRRSWPRRLRYSESAIEIRGRNSFGSGQFDKNWRGCPWSLPSEGAADWQSAFGKVIQGVGIRCREKGIPAVALVGSMGRGAEDIYDYGIESVLTAVNAAMSLPEAMDRAEEFIP